MKNKKSKKEGQNKNILISFLLRSGLAIVFFYAGISSFLAPTNWIGFVPNFIGAVIPKEIFLIVFSTYEILLGIGLLFDYKTFALSILSSATLFLILFGNIMSLELLFRDIAILFMALALIALSYKKMGNNKKIWRN
ncbi:hypothetical protein HYS72_03095 [Candidatus Pacearchaeota archaeon]|nr:hypothetical protein [Candidatus Pacearchaeota archaeon]